MGARTTILLGATALAAATATWLAPVSGAAQLTCDAVPGTSATAADGVGACSARADQLSRSFASTTDGVAYAGARHGALTAGLGVDGGVGAVDASGGLGFALAVGQGAVTLVSADPGAIVLAASGVGAQVSVGRADEGVICQGPSFAVDLSTGRLCLSDGVDTFELPVPNPPVSSAPTGSRDQP